MMRSYTYDAIITKATELSRVKDNLAIEAGLQININNEPYTVVMRTPGHDDLLIRGLFYAEDIYKGNEDLHLTTIEKHENGFATINVTIPKKDLGKGYLNKRTLLSVSSCGICGKQQLEDVMLQGENLHGKATIPFYKIKEMYLLMKDKQSLFKTTGGSHATAAFDKHSTLLSIQEDIGRHNALDKVVGQLLNENNLQEAAIILISGRVSYEIVSKAFFAKIPVIVAVSACSSLAVDYAKEFGICLVGFNREDKATIYANPHYLEL